MRPGIKILTVNKEAQITEGYFKGHKGKVIGYDITYDEVMIQMDAHSSVTVPSGFVSQEGMSYTT